MMYEKKFFGNAQNGGGDFDSAPFAVGPNKWINASNIRTLTTDYGKTNTVESLGANVLKNNQYLQPGTNIFNGYALDEAKSRILYFVWNSNGDHGIYAYYINTEVIYVVLLSNQVSNGLSLDKDFFIHSARVVNGCLYWTDNLNEPRRVYIDAGIKSIYNIPKTGSEVSFGYLVTTFNIPDESQIVYGPNITLAMIRVGTLGAQAAPTRISIVLDWSNYPVISAKQVLINGLIDYFSSIGTGGVDYTISGGVGAILTIRVRINWDMGTGDPAFQPVTSIDIIFNNMDILYPDVDPYSFPIKQSVISIIRRQPGLPPIQNKIFQTSPTVESNQIALGAWTFAYRYIYRNYEPSTLSGQSTLTNYNADQDNFNRIDISIPLAEQIDQDVIQIDLVARDLNTETYFIIKSWLKSVTSDATQISNHNAGVAALTFSFYNNLSGQVLDSAYSVKLFDSAPYKSQTLEFAKNRLFQGNYKIGYDTPIETSLSVTTGSKTFTPGGGGGPITGEWYLLRFFAVSGTLPVGFHVYYVIQTLVPILGIEPLAPIYIYTYSATTVPPYPASVNSSDLTFAGSTPQAAANSINSGGINAIFAYADQSQASIITASVTPPSNVVGIAFKSDSFYQLSISFKDNYGRECGILTNKNLVLTTPDTGLSAYTYITNLMWSLNNANALSEIPDWAYYYSINITKCLKTRFFLQSLGVIIYAGKDSSGNYTFTTDTYSSDLAGVAIDISFLNTHAQGYVLNIGDIARLYVNGAMYVMSIIDQSAQYIICQLMDVGSLNGITGRYEIYTPYKQQTNEPYFEVSQIYSIENPGTNTRQYGTLTGSIFGDVYLFGRINSSAGYITEAMNITDKHYTQWFTNSGRPNFIDYIGATDKQSSVCFSNTFVPGSRNNGLSTFEALNSKDVYPECGELEKLQLTSKVEGEIGTIMLAICIKETASLYMSETQVMSTQGSAFVAQNTDVIGTINVLKGSFGTINPESVVEFRGNVFWVDALNGKVIQYSANGLFPISNYQATKFWKLFCAQYISMTKEEIEALGSRPFIFSGVDSNNWELLLGIPKTLNVPPYGYLPDYPDEIYPFDIWDGQAKTIVYKLNASPNHWSGSYPFSPEGIIGVQNMIFSFSAANIYQHNSDIFPCTYYGQPVKSKIMFILNQQPNRPKVYNNVSVEGNSKPDLIYMRTEPSLMEFDQFDLEEQASDLLDFDFEVKEGILYAAIYRNKLQPTATGFNTDGLLTGDEMRAYALLVMAVWSPQKGPLELRFITFGYQISVGHST